MHTHNVLLAVIVLMVTTLATLCSTTGRQARIIWPLKQITFWLVIYYWSMPHSLLSSSIKGSVMEVTISLLITSSFIFAISLHTWWTSFATNGMKLYVHGETINHNITMKDRWYL